MFIFTQILEVWKKELIKWRILFSPKASIEDKAELDCASHDDLEK